MRKIVNVFLSPISFNICLGAQKGRLIETVPLSTHNICLGWYALLTKVLLKWVNAFFFFVFCFLHKTYTHRMNPDEMSRPARRVRVSFVCHCNCQAQLEIDRLV